MPRDVVPEIIASDMRFNGAPMQIVQFITLDAEETLKFYRKYFEENASKGKYSESVIGERTLVGALMDQRLVNVELTARNRKAVHVLVSSIEPKLAQPAEKLAKDMPRMPGSQVIQHQDSRDGEKTNRFVIVQNQQSVDGNAMYLREHYIAAGWRRDGDETIKPAVHRQLWFSRGKQQLLVDVQRLDRGKTTVIYNEMSEK